MIRESKELFYLIFRIFFLKVFLNSTCALQINDNDFDEFNRSNEPEYISEKPISGVFRVTIVLRQL